MIDLSYKIIMMTSAAFQPQLLQEQLLNNSILRLWRTGADFRAWSSKEDNLTHVSSLITCAIKMLLAIQ